MWDVNIKEDISIFNIFSPIKCSMDEHSHWLIVVVIIVVYRFRSN